MGVEVVGCVQVVVVVVVVNETEVIRVVVMHLGFLYVRHRLDSPKSCS